MQQVPPRGRDFVFCLVKGSVEVKHNLDAGINGNGLAVLLARFEAPSFYGLDGLFIESKSQTSAHGNVTRNAVGSDHQAQHNRSLVLRLAGFFRIFWLGIKDHLGCGHAAADVKCPTTDSSTVAWSHARTRADANSAAATRSNSSARAGSVRRRSRRNGSG